MVLRKDHALKIYCVDWWKAYSRVQGGGLIKNWWFWVYVLFPWSFDNILQFRLWPTYWRQPWMLQTAAQNKKVSSNWPPFSHNKLPVWFNKSTSDSICIYGEEPLLSNTTKFNMLRYKHIVCKYWVYHKKPN